MLREEDVLHRAGGLPPSKVIGLQEDRWLARWPGGHLTPTARAGGQLEPQLPHDEPPSARPARQRRRPLERAECRGLACAGGAHEAELYAAGQLGRLAQSSPACSLGHRALCGRCCAWRAVHMGHAWPALAAAAASTAAAVAGVSLGLPSYRITRCCGRCSSPDAALVRGTDTPSAAYAAYDVQHLATQCHWRGFRCLDLAGLTA
mmetsp:Transcript_109595/g.353758  ORF Transcript_109595/g.353758 Transcript_109595/m.353758 type:complete len:205 (-) Transcript_109595:445-1059(-)